jgi:hypothetical protein
MVLQARLPTDTCYHMLTHTIVVHDGPVVLTFHHACDDGLDGVDMHAVVTCDSACAHDDVTSQSLTPGWGGGLVKTESKLGYTLQVPHKYF